ncbi:MAG: DUF4097 family beta strand repeat protein [Candidatus Eisenbacteria bacterium]|nr:DUF4097 family beta strand repeat protein [Candidatus Eisenbacteria bacterium]
MKRLTQTAGWIGGLVLLLALFAGDASADRPVDETRALDGDGRLEIEILSGSVHVIGWNKKEVRIEGELEDDVEELEIDGDAKRLSVRVVLLENRRTNEGDAYLTLHVPERCVVDFSAISADLEVRDFLGGLIVESVSGEVDVEGKMNEAEVEAVSGNVRLKGSGGRFRVETVSGDIELDRFEGGADLHSTSGDVRVLAAGGIDRLRVETLSGDMFFHGKFAGEGTYRFQSHSGDVTLEIEGDTKASFDVQTFSGDIDNDFGSDGRRTSRYTSGRELNFTTGGGGADVRIETFSGDVSIEKN